MKHRFDAVVHFAAFKAVGESMDKPLEYYHNNIGGSMSLLESMRAAGVKVCIPAPHRRAWFTKLGSPRAHH